MTSEQVMLTTAVLCVLLCGCASTRQPPMVEVGDPALRRVFAVAPIRNESGSLQADGLIIADHLTRQLETVTNIDVLPVNRTLAAMEALKMPAIATAEDALRLVRLLSADALIIGTITAYDPYDPPKLGLALEMFTPGPRQNLAAIDLRALSSAATAQQAQAAGTAGGAAQEPAIVASAFFDAADATVRQMLIHYAEDRGNDPTDGSSPRLHRINMDLFSQFVTHVMSRRLLAAQAQRLAVAAPPSVPDR